MQARARQDRGRAAGEAVGQQQRTAENCARRRAASAQKAIAGCSQGASGRPA